MNTQLDEFDKCKSLKKKECSVGGVIAKGVYDRTINKWFKLYPHHSFCIINMDYLRMSHVQALTKVTKWLGVSDYDWNQHEIVAQITRTNLTMETIDDLKADRTTVMRLDDYYADHPSKYFAHVFKDGSYGCRPDVDGGDLE